MAGGGKAEIRANRGQRFIRIAEEAFCFLRFSFRMKSAIFSPGSSLNLFDKYGRLIYSAPAIALDGRVTVGISKTCVACAEPVAHDGADSALAVVIDDGRVFNRHLIAPGQIVQHRQTCNDLTGLHIQSQQLDGVSIVGEHHKLRRQRRRAAAAPGKTAAGGLVALAADFCANALIRRAPRNVDAIFCAQQIAIHVRQNDCAVLGGGDAVFCTLTGSQLVDKDCIREISLFAA